MDTLFVISSKSPNPNLYTCVNRLYDFYINNLSRQKVCIIDSDSDNIDNYTKVKRDFPHVDIHFVKNKNYEYGAWKYAYTLYPNYNKYVCIQDNIIFHKHAPLDIIDNNNTYILYHFSGFYCHPEIKEKAKPFLTSLDYTELIDTPFTLASHSSFIVSNDVMKDIFDTLKQPPIDKDGSCIYERCFSLYFILKNIKTHNLYEYASKIHGGRM